MGNNWRACRLGDLLSFSNGRTSPERSDDYSFPVYGSNGIIGYADKTNSEAEAIIIGRVSSYCGSLYTSTKKCWITDNAIRAVAIDNNNPKFLFYLLGTLRLNNWRSGSGQPLLNQSILGKIPTIVPPLAEQRAIAQVLGTLDDKIELNRRMNQTLENMAQPILPYDQTSLHQQKLSPKKTIAAFSQHVYPMLQRIAQNERESRTLATLRDTLLPRLMSGHLRVGNIEKFAGKAP